MPPVTDRKLVGTEEAARILGIHPHSLRRWERLGLITPAARTMGGLKGRGHARWDVEDLRRQLERGGFHQDES